MQSEMFHIPTLQNENEPHLENDVYPQPIDMDAAFEETKDSRKKELGSRATNGAVWPEETPWTSLADPRHLPDVRQ